MILPMYLWEICNVKLEQSYIFEQKLHQLELYRAVIGPL